MALNLNYGWYNITLGEIVDAWKDGDNEPLSINEVDRLIEILRAKINLCEGNITQEEYDKILG